MNSIISVENLSKQYRIGTKLPYKTFRESLMNAITSPAKLFKRNGSGEDSTIWALKDVSFEVQQGEVIGIIGRNGAGKTTLLKILSRVTEPTEGEVRIRGRVGSLLEVGTGFHPELTGRENVFLNGAILGMKKKEIDSKFDEIVAFAEVEKFIDTPVKRYSSGMYVRLAFAVAAHLEPEILIVDEVLAVGDASFQKKCLGKMGEIGKEGRTILFVSHNMAAVTSLCNRTILLDVGQSVAQGKTSDIVLMYYSYGLASPASFDNVSMGKLIGDDHALLLSGAVVNRNSKPCSEVDIREPIRIVMKYKTDGSNNTKYFPNFHFFSSDGTYAFVSSPRAIDITKSGIYEAECIIPDNFLNDGAYFVGLALTSFRSGGSNMKVHFYEQNALSFNVKDPIEGVLTRNGDYVGPIPGVVRPLFDWSIRRVS
jgi:lipopolysaccharide transport system ATP-binding protein